MKSCLAALLLIILQTFPVRGAEKELVKIAGADVTGFKTENCVVSVADDTVKAEFPARKGYPSFDFPTPHGGWNLTGFTGVQVDVFNAGAAPVTAALRVDNAGDWRNAPWNTENVKVAPGETQTIKVSFGKSYGGQPGFALDPSKVTALKLFVVNPTEDATLLVKNMKAFGTTEAKPAAPAAKNVSPESGELAFESTKLKAEHSTVSFADQTVKLEFGATTGYPGVEIPGPAGGWNLAAFGGVQADLTNAGAAPVLAALRVDNAGDWRTSPWNTEQATIAPGETKTIQVTFGQSYGHPGFKLDPGQIVAIKVFVGAPKTAGTILVKNLKPFPKE